MTRAEFLNYVTTWNELVDFCQEEDCDVCEDILCEDQRCGQIQDDLREVVCNYSWEEIRDWLCGIPTGYDYYRCNGVLDYDGVDDQDFEDYKSEVLNWMDVGDYWDEEEEDDDDFVEDNDADDAESGEDDCGNEDDESFDEAEFFVVLGKTG